MRKWKGSIKSLAILLTLCMIAAILPTVAAGEADDQSVDNSTTTVNGIIVFQNEAGETIKEQQLCTTGPLEVDYSNPCSKVITDEIEQTKTTLEAYAEGNGLNVISGEEIENPFVSCASDSYDNRKYRWVGEDGDKHMLITGDYGRQTEYSVYLTVTAPAASTEQSFTVHFDARGDEEDPSRGKVTYQIGESAAVPVTPEQPYSFVDSAAVVTFTLTPPADRTGSEPIIGLRDVTNDTDIEREIILTKKDGKFSFTLTPKELATNGDISFEIFVWWSYYDNIGPNDNQFVIQTSVPGGRDFGEFLVEPEGDESPHYFGKNEAKYIYGKGDSEKEVTVTFIPAANMVIYGLVIGDVLYGFDGENGENALPDTNSPDGAYSMTVTIPTVDEEDDNFLYIEAVFTGCGEEYAVNVPKNLRWEGDIAKWDAVKDADNYGVRLEEEVSFEDAATRWMPVDERHLFTDGKCEYDFSGKIKNTGNYRFTVFATKNNVRSEGVASPIYPSTNIPTPPAITAGANENWTKGSNTGLSFTSDAEFDDFIRVEVDEETVEATNYTVVSGSTIVALNADYMETLSVGTHKLGIVSRNGTATTTFTVHAIAAHTVTFNTNGGCTVTAQTVNDGEKAVKPVDPTKSGYTFDGWYADATFAEEFDFNTAITTDVTVYAKWKENSGGGTTNRDDSAKPTITAKPSGTNPMTGDNSYITLCIALLVVSVAGICVMTVYLRKKRRVR